MAELTDSVEFRPELLSRKAEGLTWALSALMLVTWWILQANEARFSGTAAVLLAFLLFMAVGTSLGNWMDRRTVLRLDTAGVFFENGLRNVRLAWPEIEKVRVYSAQAGARQIQVFGKNAHFEFRTLAVLALNGVVKGRSGFADGDRILDLILQSAKLSKQPSEAAYSYYSRT